MADGKRPAPRPDPGAQLEELNDQLARFLQHADQLLEEWSRFGASVRTTVDQELARVEQAVGEAGERATRSAGAHLDRLATERIDRAVGEGLTRVKAELDRAGRGTSIVAPVASPPHRALLGAVVLANVLLIVLVVLALVRGAPAPARASGGADAAVEVPGPPPEVQRACATLVDGWQAEAAEVVLRAGLDACGAADLEAVRAHLVAPPTPVDAGPPDAAPAIDARRKPR